jgi:hypothetical protein
VSINRIPFDKEPDDKKRFSKKDERGIQRHLYILEKEIHDTGLRMYSRSLTDREVNAACELIVKAPALSVEEAIKLALGMMGPTVN